MSAYTWKPAKDVEVTVHADERTERGFGTGADVQYHMGPDGLGLVTGYYLNDAEPYQGGNRFEESNINHNRYLGEWQHKQYLTNDVTVTVDLNKLSDSAVMNDFFRKEFNHDREPDSVADITKRGPDYTLSFLTEPQFNEFFAGVERLPETKLAVWIRTRPEQHAAFLYPMRARAASGSTIMYPGTQMYWGAWRTPILSGTPCGPTHSIKSSCQRCWEAGFR